MPIRSGGHSFPERNAPDRWFAAAVPAAVAAAVVAYADGPPVAHTGGFGEPTCTRCHADQLPNAPGGHLSLVGLPERYAPGARYRITVTLARPGLRRGGVQLAVRHTDGPFAGRQAGVLASLDARTRVEDGPDGVQYLSHSETGSIAEVPDTLRWTFSWTAPREFPGTVVAHVAANASNDDASEFGDRIYTREVRVQVTSSPSGWQVFE